MWAYLHRIWQHLGSWWRAYRRAYSNQPDWPLILLLRMPLFTRTARQVCQFLIKGNVLDIGTGPGQLPLRLTQVASLVRCIGIDVEPILLNDAYKKAVQKQISDRATFLVADVQMLPFTDRTFDLVVSTFSLHLWKDRKQGITEIYRVLKYGGIALTLVGRRFCYPERFYLLDLITKKSAKYARELFGDTGFTTLDVTYSEIGTLQVVARK